MKKKSEEALSLLRQKIDKIDEKLISLFEERMKIVAEVGQLKKNNKERFFIKSAREADMIKSLIAKSNLPQSLVVDIWRKLITTANICEQPFSIAAHRSKKTDDYERILRQYYNDSIPILYFDKVDDVIDAAKKNAETIAVFALPTASKNSADEDQSENWWINLANDNGNLKVFAQLPLIKLSNRINLVAAATKEVEQSSSDNSLIYIELENEFSESDLIFILSSCQFSAKILRTSIKSRSLASGDFRKVLGSAELPRTSYLIESEEFLSESDEKIKNLKIHLLAASQARLNRNSTFALVNDSVAQLKNEKTGNKNPESKDSKQTIKNSTPKPLCKILGHYPKQITSK